MIATKTEIILRLVGATMVMCLVLSHASFAQFLRPTMTVFSDASCSRDGKEIKQNVQDLRNIYSKQVKSVYFEGTWVIYGDPFYNERTNHMSSKMLSATQSGCNDVSSFNNKQGVRSIRVVGALNNYSASTITLYQRKLYGGTELFIGKNLKSLTTVGKTESVIITANDSWEMFLKKDFQGNSTCLSAAAEYDGLFSPLPIGYNHFKSARRGCGKQ